MKILHPEIRVVDKKTNLKVLGQNSKFNLRKGFLHIPKTGGSGIFDFMNKNQSSFSSIPVPLFHTWTARLIKEYFPNMKISFVIRDPLERTISGFQSRLRMGQPKYFVPWKAKEAAAFALFHSVEDFLNGLLEESDFYFSATEHALMSIIAIQWNYEYYFESTEFLVENKDLFGPCCEINKIQELLQLFLSDQKENQENPLSQYLPTHTSKKASNSYLNDFTNEQIAKMKSRLSNEYKIYEALKEMHSYF